MERGERVTERERMVKQDERKEREGELEKE